MIRKGIPEPLSKSLAAQLILVNALDILEIAGDRQEPERVAEVYFGIEKILGLDWLAEPDCLPPGGERLARKIKIQPFQ